MEDLKEIAKLLFEYGGTVVMAVLFIVYLYIDRKDRKDKELKEQEIKKQENEDRKTEREANNKLLSELSASNRNIAESLNLLKTSIDTNTTEFRQHDERAIQEFGNIKNDLTILKERK